MNSNEERREIAARLRNYENLRESFRESPICAFVNALGFDGYLDWKGVCNRLADLIEPEPINGETSDGYHTFNELYHHRALLFSVVVRNYPELCWKSKKHHTGDMYEGMFIVGINTPDGQASYHYDIKPYWDMFECEELEFAPEWDGHTPAQAIERIGKLTRHDQERMCKNITDGYVPFHCSECDCVTLYDEVRETGIMAEMGMLDAPNYCPNCGAKVVR